MSDNYLFRLDRVEAGVSEQIHRFNRARTFRHRVTAVAATAIVAVAVTAGTLSTKPASNAEINNLFDCYTTTDLSAEHSMVSFASGTDAEAENHAEAPLPLQERVNRAKEQCGTGFKTGLTGPHREDALQNTDDPNSNNYPVPEEVVCQLPDNRLAVFPKEADKSDEQFCTAVGLHIPTT